MENRCNKLLSNNKKLLTILFNLLICNINKLMLIFTSKV